MNTVMMEKVAESAPMTYGFLFELAPYVREDPFMDEIMSSLDGIMKKAEAVFEKTAASSLPLLLVCSTGPPPMWALSYRMPLG